MNANHIESKFAMMGARLKVSVLPEQRVSEDYAVDIQRDRHGEYFELRVPEKLNQRLDVNVLSKPTRATVIFSCLFVRLTGNLPGSSADMTSGSGLWRPFRVERRLSCRPKRL